MPYGLKLVLYLIGAGSLGFILAAILERFDRDINLLFSIAVAYVVIIVGLNFDDHEFCAQVCELLKANFGRSLVEIGSLDIP
jgi:hypothetical protein